MEHTRMWSAVSAREDVDGTTPTVIYQPDRRADLAVEMEPSDARRLARALNKAAKRLES